MTLPYSPSRAVYQGNGAATAFPFAFKVWNTDQLDVSVTSPAGHTAEAQGWTASLGESGGTITYLHNGAPLPAGWRLSIVRDMPFAQSIDLVSASRFDPQVIEDGLDQATAELQQLNEKITRAVILPATSEQSPEDVVQSIYASRDAAEASASNADSMASEAAESATLAANRADAAAASATAAAQSAITAADAVPEKLAQRVTDAETKSTQQDARLTSVESSVTALATTLIGSEIACYATASYVPLGSVPEDGAEYSDTQFPSLYADYLAGGRLLTCTYAEYAAQLALTGNCAKFALDTVNKKFRVPFKKDGDSTTQALSPSEVGKSVKAGLPDVSGGAGRMAIMAGAPVEPPFVQSGAAIDNFGGGSASMYKTTFSLSSKNPIYRSDVNTVLDEQVRLRHFIVVASAQNSASMFDWSNYMAALAGKANTDLSNATGNALNYYLHVCDEKPTGTGGGSSTGGAWQTRDLTAIKENRIGATLTANRFRLPAGRYFIRARAPVYAVYRAKTALFNATTSTYMLYSNSVYADYNYNGNPTMFIEGEFTLTDTTDLELRTWCQSSIANSGMGFPAGVPGVVEKYSEAFIWKM